MSAQENKKLIRHVIEEGFNKGNLAVADDSFMPDYEVHAPGLPPLSRGPQAFKNAMTIWRSAFSDIHMTIEELVGEGDFVVNRFTARGTHDGLLMGIPATGKPIEINGIDMHRLTDGKVRESWINNDVPAILVQLGVISLPLPPGGGPPGGGRPPSAEGR